MTCLYFQLGVLVGPFVILPFLIFSGLFLRLIDAPKGMQWVFHVSYLKYAVEGACHAIFGFNRPKLECDQIFCLYRTPAKFMKVIDMHRNDYVLDCAMLLLFCIVLQTIAYFVMALRFKYRLVESRLLSLNVFS